jgi:hypothetical protein
MRAAPVSRTEQDSQEPFVGMATVAVWRRREQAHSTVVPPDGDELEPENGLPTTDDAAVLGSESNGSNGNGSNGKAGNGKAGHANGFHTSVGAASTNGSPDAIDDGFAHSQQAGITAMMSLAGADPWGPASAEPPAGRSSVVTKPWPQIPPDQAQPQRALVAGVQGRWERLKPLGRRLAGVRWLPLTAILVGQAALSLRLVWSNSAFTDEALYIWSGRLEWEHWLHGAPVPNFSSYFSGAPVVYPPLGAMAAALGGLYGARILSLFFMLFATVLLHGVTRRIYDRRSANFAAAIFAGLGATQFLGAFATYDAMALMLLGLATWLSVRAAQSRLAAQVPLIFGAASALALADAAKYAATLFDPVVVVLAGLVAWQNKGRKHGVITILAVLWILGLLLFLGVRIGGHSYWRGINTSTLTRAHGGSSSLGIVADSFGWVFLAVILGLIGCAVAMVRQHQLPAKLCALALAGAIALAPANQARIHVFTSLFKHVGFGAWFAAAVAGYALASLAVAVPAVKKHKALMVSACAAATGILVGALLAQTHFASWPNTTTLVARMRTILPDHRGNILSADNGNVIEYYLEDEIDGSTFYGTRFFHYQDPNTGEALTNLPAYADAIRHGYFSVIILSFSDTRTTDQAIERDIRADGGYTQVARLPYRVSGTASAFRIWVREGTG